MSANFAAAYSGTIGKENAGRQFNTRLKMNIHDFISEYNNNERLMKDLFRRKRDAKNSKTGDERYIKDVKERIKAHDKLWKQATRKFFLYLANHYEGWWD